MKFTEHPFIRNLLEKRPSAPSLTSQMEQHLRERSRKRVLFVDDDDALQQMMSELQQQVRVDITSAHTATEAKVQMVQQERKFDVAILDVGILNGDGIELYRWIRNNFPKLSVVFLTGGNIDELAPRIYAVGGSPAIYPKPTSNIVTFLADLLCNVAGARTTS